MIGRTAWGALTGSGPAVRGGCRAFEFVSLAGVHSAPNTPSPGIALEIGSCGAGLFRRELVSPCWALPRGPARGGRCVSAGRRAPFVSGPPPQRPLGGKIDVTSKFFDDPKRPVQMASGVRGGRS